VLGADVGGSAGGSWDHKWTKTTGDQEAHGTSDSLSQSQGSNVAHYHANGQDITLTDGGYWRDGTFHRVENFSEKRHAIERDFSEAQSLERQATRSDEVGARLERMASISRSNGYQISDDMSQVIASRYAEMAASPEFRDLGAPSLTNTTPSPHQREVRNMIVGKILEQYAADGMAPVQAGLQDPAATMGSVRGPAEFSMPSAAPRPQGRRSAGSAPRREPQGSDGASGTGRHAPGDDAARAAIQRGD
jgi:conjugal transfer mating pair stabilization protein TraG